MKKSVLILLVLIIVFLLSMAATAQTVVDPAEYLETAKSTADINRVIRRFNEYIENNDPVFLTYGDVNITSKKGIVSYDSDDLTGSFQGFDAFMYIRLFKNDLYTARVFGTWSNLGFSLDEDSIATDPFGFSEENHTGWVTGYALFGTQVNIGEARYTLGGIMRYEPTIDKGPPAGFSYSLDSEGDFRTTELNFERIYADASIAGWRFDTQLSLKIIEHLAVVKLFELAFEGLSIGPAAQYLGRLGSFRPGFELEWKPLPWFKTRVSASAALAEGEIGFGEAGLDISMPFVYSGPNIGLWNIIIGNDETEEGNNLAVYFNARGSLLERSGELIPGGKIELSLDNVHGLTIWDILGLADIYWGVTAGISWNHAETLSRMPFEDQALIYFGIQAALY